MIDLTRQLDLIPREELRNEIRLLEGHILDMGQRYAKCYVKVHRALDIMEEFTSEYDKPLLDAAKLLRQAIGRRRKGKVRT